MQGAGLRAEGFSLAASLHLKALGFRVYLRSQVAQNNRLPYPKVAHNWLKVAPKYRLLAFQVGLINKGLFGGGGLYAQTTLASWKAPCSKLYSSTINSATAIAIRVSLGFRVLGFRV